MDEPYRLVVQKRLAALLEQITPANGFTYDLTGAVFRGRMQFGESDPLPMISIVEAQQPSGVVAADVNDQQRNMRWPLIIQGWVPNDVMNPTDPAYGFMAAVEVQLAKVINTSRNTGTPIYPEWYMLGAGDEQRNRLISDFAFGPGIVSPPREQVSTHAFFFMPVWIGLAEIAGQPYISV